MIFAWEVTSDRPDFARWCFAQALAGGVLLRPIGNTVYVMPPYIVTGEEMTHVAACMRGALRTLSTIATVLRAWRAWRARG